MQLAIVTPYPPAITGIGQYGFHLSRQLALSSVFSRIVVLTGKYPGVVAESALVRVEQLWRPNQWNVGSLIPARLNSIKPDLVWFNLGVSIFGDSPLANVSGFSSVIRTRQLGFPTLVTLHEMPEFSDLRSLQAPGGYFARYGARLLTEIAAQADIICLTIQNYVEKISSRRRNIKALHIPMGAYHAPEMLPESGAPELLFFSTLAPFKGLEVLLEAYHALKVDFPRLQLTIGGANHIRFPGYADQLKHTYQGLDGIHWAGQISEEDVKATFGRAQVVILPYKASTGSSSVLTQAAAWGRPVIASDLPEIRSSASEVGFAPAYFQSGDVPGLARVIKTYLESPQLRHRQAWHNFNAVQRFRPEEICKAYIRAFNMALEMRLSSKRIILPAIPQEPA